MPNGRFAAIKSFRNRGDAHCSLTMIGTDDLQIPANAILDYIPYSLVITNNDGTIQLCNRSAEKMFGFASSEVNGRSIQTLLPDLNPSEHKGNNVKGTDKEPGDTRWPETRAQRSDGSLFMVTHAVSHCAENSNACIHAIWDISYTKQSEDELKKSTDRINSILETIPNAIVTTDHDGNIELFNLAAEPMFQYTAEEVTGKHISVLLPALKEQNQIASKHYDMLTAVRKGGSSFPAELSVGEMNFSGRKQLACVVRDISDRIRAEQEAASAHDQLIEAEKLASLGELVAGIAHEINTPLGIGVTAASHLHEQYEALMAEYKAGELKRPTLERFLETCDQASRILNTNLRRASELIQSFKQVAVDQSSSEQRTINVSKYLDELLLSLRPKLKRTRHTVCIDCDPELSLFTYPGAISQIFTNFIVNSLIHGFEEGDAGHIHISVRENENDIEFEYADDGKGISPEAAGKIFDPFYTTKRGTGSSGLGMHIVYNLVKKTFAGRIKCDTSQKGAHFIITFPRPSDTEHGR